MADHPEPTTCGCGRSVRYSGGRWATMRGEAPPEAFRSLAECSDVGIPRICYFEAVIVLANPGRCPTPGCSEWDAEGQFIEGAVTVPAEELAALREDQESC